MLIRFSILVIPASYTGLKLDGARSHCQAFLVTMVFESDQVELCIQANILILYHNKKLRLIKTSEFFV